MYRMFTMESAFRSMLPKSCSMVCLIDDVACCNPKDAVPFASRSSATFRNGPKWNRVSGHEGEDNDVQNSRAVPILNLAPLAGPVREQAPLAYAAASGSVSN